MTKWLLLFICLASNLPLAAQVKPIVTVLDFTTNNVSESDMRSIISLLSSSLFQTGKYKVIDVTQRDMLLRELEFSVSDCTDQSCKLEIGRLLSAEMIVVGDIGRVGERYLISAKILETETANTINSSDGTYLDLESLIDDIYQFTSRLAGLLDSDTQQAAVKESAYTPTEKERSARNRLFITTGFGLVIPVGYFEPAVTLGYYPSASLSYNLGFDWGLIGIELHMGGNTTSTTNEAQYQSRLYSVPVAAGIRYTTNYFDPFFVFLGGNGGVAVNLLHYQESYAGTSDVTAVKPFVKSTLGFGIYLSRHLGVSAFGSFLMFFFDDHPYMGISPGIRLEISV